MLTREWGAKSNGKQPHLFIRGKNAALVPEFAVKNLPRQNYSLGSFSSNERPALEQNTLMMMMILEML